MLTINIIMIMIVINIIMIILLLLISMIILIITMLPEVVLAQRAVWSPEGDKWGRH